MRVSEEPVCIQTAQYNTLIMYRREGMYTVCIRILIYFFVLCIRRKALAPDLDWSLWESFILGEFVEILPELGRLVPLAEDVNAGLDAKDKI